MGKGRKKISATFWSLLRVARRSRTLSSAPVVVGGVEEDNGTSPDQRRVKRVTPKTQRRRNHQKKCLTPTAEAQSASQPHTPFLLC
jgi:hypothetical protein